ncbi:hypothetical protein BC833DRAFT_583531 [Globomyces pollinis-pini]|nr:hypothetical protein BC833DRAFT_583531 [Globomyces pollinis-pini]
MQEDMVQQLQVRLDKSCIEAKNRDQEIESLQNSMIDFNTVIDKKRRSIRLAWESEQLKGVELEGSLTSLQKELTELDTKFKAMTKDSTTLTKGKAY